MSPLPRLLVCETYKQPIREEHSLNPIELSSLLFTKLIYMTKGSDRSSHLQPVNKAFRDLSLVFLHEPSWTRPLSFHHHQFAINLSLNKEFYFNYDTFLIYL